MSNAVLLTPPVLQFFDDNGNPLSGGSLYTYAAGTTTNKATFTDDTASVQLPNPVVLDAAGRAVIWINGSYKFILKDSLGNTIRTVDDVTAFTTTADAGNSFFESLSGNGTQTAFTLSQDLGTDENAIMLFVSSGIPQCVTNGSFATDTGWTKGAGWTIGSGVATATGAISTAINQNSALPLIPGQAYAVQYTITQSAGALVPSLGGNTGVSRGASGTYQEIIICGATQVIAFTGASFTGTLDNVSITLADPAGFEIQNPANFVLNGTSLTFATPPATGINNILVFAPSLLVGAASAAAAAADASATAAANSAASVIPGAYFGTSITSVSVGTGNKSFTTQTGKNFVAGNFLLISSNATPTNYMHGQITSYNTSTGALVINITDIGGSGTAADWNIFVSGTQGATGGNGVSFKNRIINGDMRIDQRNSGTLQTFMSGVAAYAVDRWLISTTGANCTGAQTSGTGANQFAYQLNGAASVSQQSFIQRIESSNIYDLAGQTVTLSAILANSLLATVSWVAYYANSVDNFGAVTSIASGNFTVNSTPTQYSTQITLPANAKNGVEIMFYVGAQISGFWSITDIQLEAGTTITSFERLPINQNLFLCQRYYQTLECISATPAGTTTLNAFCPFPVPMRSAPAVSQTGVLTFQDGSSAIIQSSNGMGTNSGSANGLFNYSIPNFSSLTVGRGGVLAPGGSNKITLSAEL